MYPHYWDLTCTLHILGDSGRAADLVHAAAYPTAPIRKLKADENDILNGMFRDLRAIAFEDLTRGHSIQRRKKSGTNAPSLCTDAYRISSPVRHREHAYLSPHSSAFSLYRLVTVGRDFNPEEPLSVSAQVDKLILQATSLENLCQCFSGWYVRCPLSIRFQVLTLSSQVRVLVKVKGFHITLTCFRCTTVYLFGLSLRSILNRLYYSFSGLATMLSKQAFTWIVRDASS